jgi:hypothetical protein
MSYAEQLFSMGHRRSWETGDIALVVTVLDGSVQYSLATEARPDISTCIGATSASNEVAVKKC